jgi:arylsulfatase A-like enzyme/Tfp pilus assembly protein PilF
LLVTIDTLRADALGSYGAATPTPALDQLASDGIRFRNTVAHSVLTFPSHASILTGLDPSRHGVHDNDRHRLPESSNTWAERLGGAGYSTAAFIGAFPLDSVFGLAQGFDVYDDYYGSGAEGLRLDERPAESVVAAASSWLTEREGSWFAWVHVYDPHAPYRPPVPHDDRSIESSYAAEVAYVDTALAPLLELARSRNAIVVVTADHGESLGEHGESTHGVFAYAATLNVPLIIAGLEGQPTGTVVDERVSHIDILPTVLAAVGLGAGDMQGVSLDSVIAGAPHPDSQSYFEALTPFLDWGWAPLRGLYSGSLKYIELPIPELFDLDSAAGEADNLAETRNVDLARMAGELRAHLDSAPQENAATQESPETLRRLRALGYVGNTVPNRATAADFGPDDDPKRLIEIEKMIQLSVGALEAGDHQAAVDMLSDVLAQRPTMARAYTLLARARAAQAGPEAAAGVLLEAMAQGVVTPHLLGRLAFFHLQSGRLADGAAAAEQALEQQPDDVETLSLLATIYGQGGRAAEAEALLSRALELDPSYARLHANLGMIYLDSERPDAASTAFQTALSFDPGLADAHNGLGVLAAASGDLEAAVGHWQQALRSGPNQPFVLFNLSVVLRQLGRYPEAVEAIGRYVSLRPDDANGQALQAEIRREAQR